VTVRKQLSHGVSLQGAYTWSKSLTDIYDTTANSNDANNLAQQYGPSNFNRPHRLIFNYSWDLPFGKHNGIAGRLLEGWNLSGVTTIQDGIFFTPIDSRGGTAFNVSGTTIQNGYSRAQLCPGKTYADIASPGDIESRLGGPTSGGPGFFNPSAFCDPPAIMPNGTTVFYATATQSAQAQCQAANAGNPCATLYGNVGAGVLQGPGQFNFDAAVLKTTLIRENQFLQFRAEFFNLFNHPQFQYPQVDPSGNVPLKDVTQPNGSWITSTSVGPRVIQLGLKYVF
jgi:hypothetical protein